MAKKLELNLKKSETKDKIIPFKLKGKIWVLRFCLKQTINPDVIYRWNSLDGHLAVHYYKTEISKDGMIIAVVVSTAVVYQLSYEHP